MLPDVALLRIFDFYLDKALIEAWQTLVHVCRNWRNVVLGSPRRLNLQLICRARTPVREKLDLWPLLPIFLPINSFNTWNIDNIDNIITALEHKDRIGGLYISEIPSSGREDLWAALQQPFPALTFLFFESYVETPVSFLGGSAPALQKLIIRRAPFLGLPKLLVSAIHLHYLSLDRIPHSAYISPEAMATCLSVLTKLEYLHIGFESPRSRPDRRPPPQTRIHLPVLTLLGFDGVAEYLEDLVASIDAPLLDKLTITFFHQLIFDTPRLTQFINRTPKFKAHCDARVRFTCWDVTVALPPSFDVVIELGIVKESNEGTSSMVQLVQLYNSSFLPALIPAVEHLYFIENAYSYRLPSLQENHLWLELFHLFPAVKDLYISSEFMSHIASALQELVEERVTEVLPTLQNLFLEEFLRKPAHEAIGRKIEQFVSAKQLASRPIVVSRWERKRKGRSDEFHYN